MHVLYSVTHFMVMEASAAACVTYVYVTNKNLIGVRIVRGFGVNPNTIYPTLQFSTDFNSQEIQPQLFSAIETPAGPKIVCFPTQNAQ